MELFTQQSSFLLSHSRQLACAQIFPEYGTIDKQNLAISLNFMKQTVQQVHNLTFETSESLQFVQFQKPSGLSILAKPVNKSGFKMLYIGQLSQNGLPDGFGTACISQEQLIFAAGFPKVSDNYPKMTFVITGFWRAGALYGPGVVHYGTNTWKMDNNGDREIILHLNVGRFCDGALKGLGMQTDLRYCYKQSGKWIENKKNVQNNEIILGNFESGKLKGYGCIECFDLQNKQIRKTKGIFIENMLCEGDFIQNNGNGEGKTKLVQNVNPFLECIVDQNGKFNDFLLYEGKRVISVGIIQEGKFVQNQIIIGKQYTTNPDDCIYEGQFVNGLPTGFGKLILKPGDVYEGFFHQTLLQVGTEYLLPDGCNLQKALLQLVSGNIDTKTGDGEGKIISFDLPTSRKIDTREGRFEKFEQMSGVMKLSNEAQYEGEFESGNPCGAGKITPSKGEKRRGAFMTKNFPNGDQYIMCTTQENGEEVRYTYIYESMQEVFCSKHLQECTTEPKVSFSIKNKWSAGYDQNNQKKDRICKNFIENNKQTVEPEKIESDLTNYQPKIIKLLNQKGKVKLYVKVMELKIKIGKIEQNSAIWMTIILVFILLL